MLRVRNPLWAAERRYRGARSAVVGGRARVRQKREGAGIPAPSTTKHRDVMDYCDALAAVSILVTSAASKVPVLSVVRAAWKTSFHLLASSAVGL